MADYGVDVGGGEAETPSDYGKGAAGEVRRWCAELGVAESQLKKWRERSKKNWDRYRAKDKRKSSYNCLYANTNIIFPAVYNTPPKPDVRRRWADDDPVGKAVAEVIGRAIEYNVDCSNIDRQLRMDVIDMLVCARGLSRVRYVPSTVPSEDGGEEYSEPGSPSEGAGMLGQALAGEKAEELEWESAPIEHVQWDSYLIGPGKTWQDIPWIAFIHDLCRDELIEQFGDAIGSSIPMDAGPKPEDMGQAQDDGRYDSFKTARIFEIWDKESKKVIWINKQISKGPIKEEDDPYGFDGFFPCPEPLIAIVDSNIAYPVSLFEQYEEQADELDRISGRINRIVNAIKARGLYDPSLGSQVSEIFRGEDNDLIPAADSIRMLQDAGGIEKFIWFAPIEKMMQVVQGLYAAREQCKAVIYELSGISDIMRGSSDSQETLGAQNLKVAFGKGRVSDMQRNVQRYIRDLIQMQAQIIAKMFQTSTLQQMTNLNYPTDEEVVGLLMQYRAVAAQAQMTGNPPPPPPQIPKVTWGKIEKVLRSDMMRSYRVDIETDSTIAATQQDDMQQLQIGMGAVTEALTKIWPLVQQQVLPFDAGKQFVLMIARKFKFGIQMEDTLDKMQPPPPQTDPNASKNQAEMAKHQMSLQAEAQARQQDAQVTMAIEQKKAELAQQTAAWEQEVQARENAHQQQLEMQRHLQQQQFDMQMEAMKQQAQADRDAMQSQIQLLIAQMNNARAVEIAEIGAGATIAAQQISAANAASVPGEM
jgi:hypothetical protein